MFLSNATYKLPINYAEPIICPENQIKLFFLEMIHILLAWVDPIFLLCMTEAFKRCPKIHDGVWRKSWAPWFEFWGSSTSWILRHRGWQQWTHILMALFYWFKIVLDLVKRMEWFFMYSISLFTKDINHSAFCAINFCSANMVERNPLENLMRTVL